ncbi:MAG: hypothetical protein ACXAD7_25145 [Candidatus Kariarchaeaceae archaeon]
MRLHSTRMVHSHTILTMRDTVETVQWSVEAQVPPTGSSVTFGNYTVGDPDTFATRSHFQ